MQIVPVMNAFGHFQVYLICNNILIPANSFQYCYTVGSVLIQFYRAIKKDGLKFVRLYFLNYTWYVNDLHNI